MRIAWLLLSALLALSACTGPSQSDTGAPLDAIDDRVIAPDVSLDTPRVDATDSAPQDTSVPVDAPLDGSPPAACASPPFTLPTGGRSLYVSPTGDDTAAGTMAAPLRTLTRAARIAMPSDVVYVRGGTFTARQDFTATGAVGRPVVFTAYPGEHPVFDGTGVTLTSTQAVVSCYQCAHVVIDGIEVRNSTVRGLSITDSDDVLVRRCQVHDVQSRAVGLSGADLVFEDSEVWNSALSNSAGTATGGWPATINTYMRPDGSPSLRVVVRNNQVHDSWGECIDAIFVDGMIIEGNVVRDCYSVGIYVDTARNVRIDRNVVRVSDVRYRRRDNMNLMTGVLMAAEMYPTSPDFGAEDVVVANNLFLGVGRGVSWWNDPANTRVSNTYLRARVEHNVVSGQEDAAVSFPAVSAGRNRPSGNVLANNVLRRGSRGGDLSIGDTAAWRIVANVFPDGVPAIATDPSNLHVDPMFVDPAATIADGFRVASGSPCRGAGMATADVPTDFACTPRSGSAPTIGLFE